ncbi:hypothetical protein CH063_08266 [Colletotrichum higginsianum]|uniref:Uncharacterized protein n=1 Tax=Colletotrichum higginsianum (strain IMI 349063) TaxID=759273 RepID=H1V980_COLHI|nr:hypothetical protein CH063_08266 [Colletotrichum higginsianum]
MYAYVRSSDTDLPVCGTLLQGAAGQPQKSGLVCLGTEFSTKSIVQLATERWPSFVTDPPLTTATTSSSRASSATTRPTPSATSTDSASLTPACTETPTVTVAPSSVGTKVVDLVLVQGFVVMGFALCTVWFR